MIDKFVKFFLFFGLIIVGVVIYVYTLDKKNVKKMKKEEFYIAKTESKKIPKLGVWLWESPNELSSVELNEIVNYSNEHGINKIYVRIDDYIDIYELKDSSARDIALEKFNKNVENFLEIMNENGILVEALCGGVNWSNIDYRYINFLIIDYIVDFNKKNKYKFSGIQFDIEAYNSKEYKKNKTKVLDDYLETVQDIVFRIKESNLNDKDKLNLGFAIPYWFDGENSDVKLKWGTSSIKKPVGYYLFDLLDSLQGKGYVAIMSYRNHALGDDGSIAHSLDEFEYVSTNKKDVKIYIGQETKKVKDYKKISFYNMSKKEFVEEITKINNYFGKYSNFGGVIVHDFYGYEQLK